MDVEHHSEEDLHLIELQAPGSAPLHAGVSASGLVYLRGECLHDADRLRVIAAMERLVRGAAAA